MAPLVSVVIPAYNAEAFINETLRSVQMQTMQNFEAIVVDDGSTDKTRDVIETFTRDDPRFSYVYQNNAGASAARNHGQDLSQGTYITFMDADDVLVMDALEHLTYHAQKYGCDLTIGAKRKVAKRSTAFCPKLFAKTVPSAAPHMIDDLRYHVAPHAKLFHRSFLEKSKIRFIEGFTYEDFLHSCQVLTADITVGIVTHLCYFYMIRAGSISNSAAKPHNVKSRIKVETAIWDHLSQLDAKNVIFANPMRTTFRHRLTRNMYALSNPADEGEQQSFAMLQAFCGEHQDYILKDTHNKSFHTYSALLNNDFKDFIAFRQGLEKSENCVLDRGVLRLKDDYLKRFGVSQARQGKIGDYQVG